MPYQSIHITGQATLSGHGMPAAHTSNPLVPMYSTPVPASIPPQSYPLGSLPAQSQLVAAPARRSRRILVILAVAIIASAIGILIVMLT